METGSDKIIKILVIDDHPALRYGLVALLEDEADFEVVAQAGLGGEALDLYKEHKPDVTITDLQLPDIDGEVVISQIVDFDPKAVVLALTTYGGADTIKRTIEAGAKGFVLKDMARNKIVGAVRHAHAGNRVIEGVVAERLADAMQSEDLTSREVDVLKAIALGRSNKLVANQLHISEATVKNHVAKILQKLSAHDRTDAIMKAMERGIIRIS